MGDFYGAPGKPEDIRAVLAERKKWAKTGIGLKVDNMIIVGGGGLIEVPAGDKKVETAAKE